MSKRQYGRQRGRQLSRLCHLLSVWSGFLDVYPGFKTEGHPSRWGCAEDTRSTQSTQENTSRWQELSDCDSPAPSWKPEAVGADSLLHSPSCESRSQSCCSRVTQSSRTLITPAHLLGLVLALGSILGASWPADGLPPCQNSTRLYMAHTYLVCMLYWNPPQEINVKALWRSRRAASQGERQHPPSTLRLQSQDACINCKSVVRFPAMSGFSMEWIHWLKSQKISLNPSLWRSFFKNTMWWNSNTPTIKCPFSSWAQTLPGILICQTGKKYFALETGVVKKMPSTCLWP